MTNKEIIELIDKNITLVDMTREQFRQYNLDKFGVDISHDGSIYASKCGILIATVELIKMEMEKREEENGRN